MSRSTVTSGTRHLYSINYDTASLTSYITLEAHWGVGAVGGGRAGGGGKGGTGGGKNGGKNKSSSGGGGGTASILNHTSGLDGLQILGIVLGSIVSQALL
jgi:hypothetical protein